MNLANKITLSRILLVPVFLFVLLSDMNNSHLIATVIFVIASLTDGLDGYIARSRNQVTKLGKFMDPLADKLLVTAALVGLVQLGKISSWIVVIIISRELIVSVFRAVAASENIVIAASPWGKAKTVSQILAIIYTLLAGYQYNPTSLASILMYIAVILTVISGWDYIYKNRKVLH